VTAFRTSFQRLYHRVCVSEGSDAYCAFFTSFGNLVDIDIGPTTVRIGWIDALSVFVMSASIRFRIWARHGTHSSCSRDAVRGITLAVSLTRKWTVPARPYAAISSAMMCARASPVASSSEIGQWSRQNRL
jgi:hypothetical protein